MFKNRHPNRRRPESFSVKEAHKVGRVLNPEHRNKFLKNLSIIAGVVLITCLILEGAGYYALHHRKMLLIKNNMVAVNSNEDALNNLEGKNGELVNQIKALAPTEVYIAVDTAQNILYLKKGDEITRKVVVSTGSGNVLTELTGRKRTWTFDTPRGEFNIKTLTKDPIWTAPDWEFISNGEPIPRNKEDRIQEGVLGDYKLGIGNDIYFHGTIYVRTMGQHVTHGCIRVGDDDLIAMWKASKKGTKVFIY
jgi:lipoprotein-anchoring transpeptidase ErfK/SrfK